MNILSNIAVTAPIAAILAQMTVGDISPVEAESRLTVIVQAEVERERMAAYERLVQIMVEAGIIVSDSDRAKPADVPS